MAPRNLIRDIAAKWYYIRDGERFFGSRSNSSSFLGETLAGLWVYIRPRPKALGIGVGIGYFADQFREPRKGDKYEKKPKVGR